MAKCWDVNIGRGVKSIEHGRGGKVGGPGSGVEARVCVDVDGDILGRRGGEFKEKTESDRMDRTGGSRKR